MLELSQTLFWFSLITAVVASAAYVVLALGQSVPMYSVSGQTAAGNVPVVPPEREERTPIAGLAASSLAFLTTAVLGGSILFRWLEIGHIPLSNMYEATVALAFTTSAVHLVFERVTGTRRAGVVVMPIVAGFLGIASLFPSEVVPLIPALQNEPMLTVHVAAMVLSYGVLTVAFAGAVIYLVQGGADGRRVRWLPRGERAEELAHWAVLVGFPLLGVGIALGAWWANSAWGRYWGWDPKETSALMVWLSLVAYFHARSGTGSIASAPGIRHLVPAKWRRSWRPDPMWWLVIMYGLLLFTYFAVNLWITGLHSYAGV